MRQYIKIVLTAVLIFSIGIVYAQVNPTANPYSSGITSSAGSIAVGESTTVSWNMGNSGGDDIPAGGATWNLSFPPEVTVNQASLNLDGGDAIFMASWYIDPDGTGTYLKLEVVGDGIPASTPGGPQTDFIMSVTVIGAVEGTGVFSINNISDAQIAQNSNSGDDNASSPITVLAPSPVKLLSFVAKEKGIDSKLMWATASEENNSHFEVERSADGKSWSTIGEVKGSGTTARKQEYAYIDKGIGKEMSTVYYRLRQVDFDGAYEYTNVEAVNFERGKGIISIYPNPVSELLNFNITLTDKYTVELYNIFGAIVAKTTKNTLDVTDFDSGSYIVKVKDQNGLELKSEKVVIIK